MATILLHRQVESMSAGSAAYLRLLLIALRRANFEIRLVFAPARAFGNRPWSWVHRDVAELADAIVWPRTLRVRRCFLSLSGPVWRRFAQRVGRGLARTLAGLGVSEPSALGRPLDAIEACVVVEAARRSRAALVVAEYTSLAPLLGAFADARRAVLVHDLFSLRAAAFRAGGFEPDHFELTLAEEAARCVDADALIHASRDEMAAIAPLLPGCAQLWLRPTSPRCAGPARVDPGGPACAVFLGTQHRGNADALRLLLERIWPAVRVALPDARLIIVGSVGANVARSAIGQGVETTGMLADLAAIGGPDRVGLAPARLASGVSIKVADYLTLGMAVVALPAALRGFGGLLDDVVDLARDPDDFAARLVRLLSDGALRRARAEAGRAAFEARLRNDEIDAFLASVRAGRDPAR